jgi:hypothetical protein
MAVNIKYMGNENLKKVGVPIEYTEDQIIELKKCSIDPIYFIENYCYIVTIDHGIQLFKLWDFQKDYINAIHNNKMLIVMLSRQMSKTTVAAAYILWYTNFQSNKTVAIVANKEENAKETLSRYQLMYEHLPLWMQQGVKTWNKGDIELENGSKIRASATSASGLRSKSISFLYVDEASIISNTIAEQFFAATYPVISSGKTSKIVMTSTPLGYNHFWKYWNDAKTGQNDFYPFHVPYWKVPGRDKKWADEQLRLLGEVKFNQEILCSFTGSTFTLIRPDIIAELSYKHPIHSKDNLDIYTLPQKDNIYVVVSDVSSGVGGDYSALVVIDITNVPYVVVAKYRNNTISTLLYPTVIYSVATEYNNAFVLLENNYSEQVGYILTNEYGYENILYVTKNAKGQTVTGGFGSIGQTYVGVNTDKRIKRIGCFNFKSLLEEKKLLIFDADIISEISTFIESKGSYSADEGYNDDLVITLVLFGWLTTNAYFKELTDVNLRKLMYEQRIQDIEDEMLPVGYLNKGYSKEITIESNDCWFNFNIDEPAFEIPKGYLTDRL